MTLKDELRAEVKKIFGDQWTTRKGTVVPDSDQVKLGNDSVLLDATVLYADLSGSTTMVSGYKSEFAAEVYKAYLHCAAKLVRAESGVIAAYDGDRVMGVFIGSLKNTSAVRCGLKIHWAVREVVNPALQAQYPSSKFVVRHVVGVDTSSLRVARTGVRGANDLVWVGNAANYAAKLTDLDATYPTWITKGVYDQMHESTKFTNGKPMWEARSWTAMGGMSIYRSNWKWIV